MDAPAASTSANNQHHPSFAPTGTVEVPVFYPTIEEMRDFPTLINKIEQQHGAHLVCGIAKVLFIVSKWLLFFYLWYLLSNQSTHLFLHAAFPTSFYMKVRGLRPILSPKERFVFYLCNS